MTDRPIIFSAPMVRALLDGRKTQTRRLAWGKDCDGCGGIGQIDPGSGAACPLCDGHGKKPTIWQKVKPGDRLYVQEGLERSGGLVQYVADRETSHHLWRNHWTKDWQPGRFCPREFSRLTLVTTATKMERLQDIDSLDAAAEGVRCDMSPRGFVDHFRILWNSLHGDGAWDKNPEIVPFTFTVHKTNIDRMERAA